MGSYLDIRNGNFENTALCKVNVQDWHSDIFLTDTLNLLEVALVGPSGQINTENGDSWTKDLYNSGYRMYDFFEIPDDIKSISIKYSSTNLYPSHLMCFSDVLSNDYIHNPQPSTFTPYLGMSDYGNYKDYTLASYNSNKIYNLISGTKYATFIGKTDVLDAGTSFRIYGSYISYLNDSGWNVLSTSQTLTRGYCGDDGNFHVYSNPDVLLGCTLDVPNGASQIKITGMTYIPSYVHFYRAEPLNSSNFINAEQYHTSINDVVKSTGPHVFNVPSGTTKMRIMCVDINGNVVGGALTIYYR